METKKSLKISEWAEEIGMSGDDVEQVLIDLGYIFKDEDGKTTINSEFSDFFRYLKDKDGMHITINYVGQLIAKSIVHDRLGRSIVEEKLGREIAPSIGEDPIEYKESEEEHGGKKTKIIKVDGYTHSLVKEEAKHAGIPMKDYIRAITESAKENRLKG